MKFVVSLVILAFLMQSLNCSPVTNAELQIRDDPEVYMSPDNTTCIIYGIEQEVNVTTGCSPSQIPLFGVGKMPAACRCLGVIDGKIVFMTGDSSLMDLNEE